MRLPCVGDANVTASVPTAVSATLPGSNGCALNAGPVTVDTAPAYDPAAVLRNSAISHHGSPALS